MNAEELAVVASPVRRQLLEALAEPDSASNLARRLGTSRQRIGYHMRALEQGGFLELVRERRQRGCMERLYRARRLTYVLEPAPGDDSARDENLARRDRFSWAALMSLAGRVLRDLVALRKRADREGRQLATLTLDGSVSFANPSERKAFTEEVTATLHGILEKYQSNTEGARRYQVFLGAYPYLAKSNEKSATP